VGKAYRFDLEVEMAFLGAAIQPFLLEVEIQAYHLDLEGMGKEAFLGHQL